MKTHKRYRRSAIIAACGLVASVAIGLTSAAANAETSTGGTAATSTVPYRQLVGRVSAPALFEASVPVAGSYAFEYVILDGEFAAYDTYVDDRQSGIGYTGGVPGGPYRTSRTVELTAGGHLVRVVGPEGWGSAEVYIVQVS